MKEFAVDKEFEEEVERRIAEMEAEDYEIPGQFTKRDWILAFTVIGAMGVLMIAGAWL